MENGIGTEELLQEKQKLEGDRAALSERLLALNAERERAQQQLAMIAGALQTVNHFIGKTDPQPDLSPDESHGPGPDEEK